MRAITTVLRGMNILPTTWPRLSSQGERKEKKGDRRKEKERKQDKADKANMELKEREGEKD